MKLFKNCYCATKKEHLRELQKDHDIVFGRVCNGSDELDKAIQISEEIHDLTEHYFD